MSLELKDLMTEDEANLLHLHLLSDDQQELLLKWGMRMYSLGEHKVADIYEIKYEGRLIILDDETQWEVDSLDSSTSEMWDSFDKIVVIDDEMFKLDGNEKVSVQEV